MPEGHVQRMTCSLKQSFRELRNHFSSEFSQPPEVILMIFDGMYGSVVIWDVRLLLLCSSIMKTEVKTKFTDERFHSLFQVWNLQIRLNYIVLQMDLLYRTLTFWIQLMVLDWPTSRISIKNFFMWTERVFITYISTLWQKQGIITSLWNYKGLEIFPFSLVSTWEVIYKTPRLLFG